MSFKPPIVRRTTEPTAVPAEEAVPAVEARPLPQDARPASSAPGRRMVDPNLIPDAKPSPKAEAALASSFAALDALVHGGIDMAALMGGIAPGRNRLEPGQPVKGTVVAITSEGAQIDLGARAEGFLHNREAAGLKVGDPISAWVVSSDDLGVQISRRLTGESAANHLTEAFEQGIPVEAKVESRSGGGYTVRVGPVRAFLPMGQASRLPLANPDALLGTTIAVRVIETGEKVVVSRKVIEESELVEQRAARLATLKEGAIVEATITSVQSWAVFLDVDGVELMLSRREASWEEVSDLTSRFDRGQLLTVRVLGRGDGDRILVTARDPGLDPWTTATHRLVAGTPFHGRVTGQTDFGVFVELLPGVQGLVHRSRLTRLPEVGASLDVIIQSVDAARKRVELVATDPAFAKASREAPPVDEEDQAWRSSMKTQGKGNMGTLGDLFRR